MSAVDPIQVRPATREDLDATVVTHLESFPGFFLSFLGPRFLKEFYRGLIDAPVGVLLVAREGERLAGFVGGTTDEATFFRWLLSERRRAFVQEAALAAARHPSSIPRLWRARRRESSASSSAAIAALLTLGVAPAFRRRGLGEQLVRGFGDELARRGIGDYCLTTDANSNAATNHFYVALGMNPVATHTTPEGRLMTEYLCHIPYDTEIERSMTSATTAHSETARRQTRVAFLCQWFPPEPGVPEISFGIAKGLQDSGYAVQAITGVPNYPTGKVLPGYSASHVRRELVRGLPTLRTPLYPSHDSSAVGRALNYLSFMASSALFGRRYLSTSDINFVISSPATLDATAALFRAMKGRPYVLSIQDLWPESVYATGFLESGVARQMTESPLRWYCDATMRHAAAVLVITPSMKDAVVARGVPASKVHVVYNWVDEDVFRPAPHNPALRRLLHLPDDSLLFLYSGNVGSAQNLDVWIDAFTDGGLPRNAHLVIQGDGHRRADLMARAGSSTQIHFLPQLPELVDAVANMQGADAMVVSLADHGLSAYTMPSKIPSALALGKAVVATVPGDAALVLENSGAGFVAPPGSAESARSVVRAALTEGRQSLESRGLRARAYYDQTMSRDRGLAVLSRVIDNITSADAGTGSP